MATHAAPGGEDGQPPQGRPRNRALDATVFLVILALGGAVVYISPYNIAESILSPYGAFVVIVMVIEYLVIKSGDRTRAYQFENSKHKEQRRKLDRALREAEALLGEIPVEGDDAAPIPKEVRARIVALREKLRNL
ncbi:MAG: hypothetical protein SF028_05860 [Candidatus Sumerlaeia bacterium]|nr:hypothetical protein [Candidatus Sumerlaeia bacterium]